MVVAVNEAMLQSTSDTFLHTLCVDITVDNSLSESGQTACVDDKIDVTVR